MLRPDLPLTRDLVLIGGGHAHALVLRRWGMDPLPGARVTLINPGATAPYTGMLPGHVAGHYARAELEIDLVRLARFAGARLIDGAVTEIDAKARLLTVPGSAPVAYDVASLDIGVTSEMPALPGFAEHGTPAKPLDRFAEGWRGWRDAALAGSVSPDVAVIGGGVAGVELALAVAHALRAGGRPGRVAVIEAAPHMGGVSDGARRRLSQAMAALDVTLHLDAGVARVTDTHVELADGQRLPATFVIGAAGARPHGWLARTGLPLHEGYVRVGPTLLVEGREDFFAAGDCAHLSHAPRPKAGVFAVREAPVLYDNLRAALSGGAMRSYRPQERYLKLISLGEKSALAERGGLSLSVAGPLLWRWKDRIDRRFMDRLRDLPTMEVPPLPAIVATGMQEATDGARPLCAGCGSKVGAAALARALEAELPPARGDVLSRLGDDAAILATGGDARQVLTTDHLRAFTADPALFARIAAVHALGDVWAMGAAPQAALATLVLPRMSEALQARTLAEMLEAAGDILRGAGADLVGGHSMMGAELSAGFAVTGLVDGAAIGLDGARPGDAILLTRPIGSGTLLAAEMAGRAPGRDVMAMLHRMAMPQGDAAAILKDAAAMTDVTGFGLAGHLTNICRASGVAARIDLGAVPLYEGALALAEAGIRSTIHASNVAAAPVAGGAGARLILLHDPQTAGGFLAAIPEARAAELLDRLGAAGHQAARIGTFVAGRPGVTCA